MACCVQASRTGPSGRTQMRGRLERREEIFPTFQPARVDPGRSPVAGDQQEKGRCGAGRHVAAAQRDLRPGIQREPLTPNPGAARTLQHAQPLQRGRDRSVTSCAGTDSLRSERPLYEPIGPNPSFRRFQAERESRRIALHGLPAGPPKRARVRRQTSGEWRTGSAGNRLRRRLPEVWEAGEAWGVRSGRSPPDASSGKPPSLGRLQKSPTRALAKHPG